MADDELEWDRGIGVDPVSRVDGSDPTGVAVRNVVRGVPPGGQPWVIRKFKAEVEEDGEIELKGKRLLVAGGPLLGTTAGVTTVFATLFCDTPDSVTSHRSDPFRLESDGDFKFEGALMPPPPRPEDCENPVLLIRAFGAEPEPWIAGGGNPELD